LILYLDNINIYASTPSEELVGEPITSVMEGEEKLNLTLYPNPVETIPESLDTEADNPKEIPSPTECKTNPTTIIKSRIAR
jgi:hypothetical protein